MSSPLTLIVLGQAYFFGTLPNNPITGTNATPSLVIASQPPQNSINRSDYTYTPGIGSHKVHIQAATWNEARKSCEAEGGYLAIINSVAESQAIMELLEKSGTHIDAADPAYVHLGFHDFYQGNEFVTIHGQSLEAAGYAEWDADEPGSDNDEHCGSMHEGGKLNDISCEQLAAFVCESFNRTVG